MKNKPPIHLPIHPSIHPSITHPVIHPALPTSQAQCHVGPQEWNYTILLSWVTSWWETDIKTTDHQLMTSDSTPGPSLGAGEASLGR